MFQKIKNTTFTPSHPVLIWDGECGFCNWWKTRWELKTNSKIHFETYQQSASKFPDIPLKEFKKASRLIEPDGEIYSGPDSAYRSLYLSGDKKWHKLYKTSPIFQYLSDHGYNHIAKNRHFYFKITKLLLGKDPYKPKFYWVLYIIVIIIILIILI